MEGSDQVETIPEKPMFCATVNLPVNVSLTEFALSQDQQGKIAEYIANFSIRCGRIFKPLKWEVGAFAYRAIRLENEVCVCVFSLSNELVLENKHYTKQQFQDRFGDQDFVWPEKEDDGYGKMLCIDGIKEPKIQEIIEDNKVSQEPDVVPEGEMEKVD